MKYLIVISGLIGSLLLYMLSSATENTDLFSRNYTGLLVLAAVLAVSLILLVGYQLWQLRRKLQAKVFGAQLTLRLALFFTLIAILPGLLVYAVSVRFLGKSIESWFDVRVEKALEGGLNLGRSALENGLKELSKKGQFTASVLARQPSEEHKRTLNRLVDEGVAQEAVVFDDRGKALSFSVTHDRPPPARLDIEMLHEIQQSGQYSIIDTLPDNSLVLRVWAPFYTATSPGRHILQLVQPVPQQLSADAQTVQGVYRDYQELTLSRLGLKRLYSITLTLSLLIVLLSAVSAAFFISGRLSAPLAALAEGTRAVAQGDFSQQHPVQSSDELGALTGLFNQMTRQLADAKTMSERQQRQVENAKAYLESVLAHLSSGVIVVDEQFRLRSVNSSAVQILDTALLDMLGEALPEIAAQRPSLRPFTEAVIQAFKDMAEDSEWQRQIERLSKNGDQILLMRGTRLATAAENGYVVVFDDITYLLQAERQAAWGEVARRLAHEIKNPLTPIQLSAEHLLHKLKAKLGDSDALLLQRATQTIVSQVAAMKNMVLEFSDYARAPAPKLVALDMHLLLREVLGLYVANTNPIRLQLDAVNARINGDATRMRQVIHNLLQNAHDALKNVTEQEIVLTTSNTMSGLQLCVQDNGSGFPEQILARAFEPYMTTKPRGTGLGLAIVKKIVEEHGGSIAIENVALGGTRVTVTLPLLTEKEVA